MNDINNIINEEKRITLEKFPLVRNLDNDQQRKIFTIGGKFIVRPDAEIYTKDWSYSNNNNKGKIINITKISTVGEEYGKKSWLGYTESQADDIVVKGKKDWWHYKSLYNPDIYKDIKKTNSLMWKTEPLNNQHDYWHTEALDNVGNVVYILTYKDDDSKTYLLDVRNNVRYTIPDELNAGSGYISRNKGYALADKLNDYYNSLPF